MDINKSKENKWLGVGIFAALAASLCCIAPVLAILGGLGGIASAFSWLEPFRSYLIGISIVALGAAFYQAYKPKKQIQCDCENDEKPNFINSKKFLWIILFVSILLFSFPYYSGALFPNIDNASTDINTVNIVKAKIDIEGMTCESCENTINYSLKTTKGVISASSSYKTGVAEVTFDKSKVQPEKLKEAIEKTGYKVKDVKKLDL